MDKLSEHFTRMQAMASQYLEPAPYRNVDGELHTDTMGRNAAFINDILVMLDGQEQRDAQK